MAGGASMGFTYAPNTITVKDAIADTSWHKIGVDGTAASASNLPWPNLDPGGFLQNLMFRSENAAADGGPFYIAFNLASAPADSAAEFVSGSGQTIVIPGNVWNVWVRKTVAGDSVDLIGRY